MSKSEAQAWMAGWEALRERERHELRSESYEEKFRALAFLMASTDLFDVFADDAEDAAARSRWARLRAVAGDG